MGRAAPAGHCSTHRRNTLGVNSDALAGTRARAQLQRTQDSRGGESPLEKAPNQEISSPDLLPRHAQGPDALTASTGLFTGSCPASPQTFTPSLWTKGPQ